MSRRVAPVTEPTKCRACGMDVLWTEWASGKRMPVDSEPDMRPAGRGGDLVLTLSGGQYGKLVVEKYDARKHDAKRNRYTSHFKTCPNRNDGGAR